MRFYRECREADWPCRSDLGGAFSCDIVGANAGQHDSFLNELVTSANLPVGSLRRSRWG